jgi:HlyD family secretion protein
MTRPRRTVLLAFVILVLAAGGYGLWRWPHALSIALFGPPANLNQIAVSGNIEAHESVLSFTQVQAPIVSTRC